MTQVRPPHQEIEIKLRLPGEPSVRAIRAKLKKLGAKSTDRIFETNILFDHNAELRAEGKLLRIRLERKALFHANEPSLTAALRAAKRPLTRTLLTYKSPSNQAIDTGQAPLTTLKYKQRTEIEVTVAPGENLQSIFEGIGFSAGFTYEKLRTTYRLKKLPGLEIELDETPIGTFLELEGSPKAIDQAAALLGFHAADYLTATYWDLHVADCRGRRVEPGHMVFKP
jgi:adenylate cyclase class IV